MYEEISVGLAITTAIAGTVAFIYRRGIKEGIDTACGKRIEKKIDDLRADDDKVHGELKAELHEIHTKIDHLTGAFETFRHLIKS